MKNIQSQVLSKFDVQIIAPPEQLKNFISPDQFQYSIYRELIHAGSYFEACTAVCEFCRIANITPSQIIISKNLK